MNLKVEMILMVIVAFLIGWFLRTMMSGSSIGSGSRVKAVGGKHARSPKPLNNLDICHSNCGNITCPPVGFESKPCDDCYDGCNSTWINRDGTLKQPEYPKVQPEWAYYFYDSIM